MRYVDMLDRWGSGVVDSALKAFYKLVYIYPPSHVVTVFLVVGDKRIGINSQEAFFLFRFI